MSLLQFSIMLFFLLTMFALPIKMRLRLLCHIKYVGLRRGLMCSAGATAGVF